MSILWISLYRNNYSSILYIYVHTDFWHYACSGYMAPEYAFNGIFSTKSDIFSFGITVLEIISGKKSTGFNHENIEGLTLIGHVSLKMLHCFSELVSCQNLKKIIIITECFLVFLGMGIAKRRKAI